jgi:glutathionylspermidine synthase
MKALEHPNRNQFFRQMGLKWYNIAPIDDETGLAIPQSQQPYGMYHCHKVSAAMVQEMKSASRSAGSVIKKIWEVVRGLDDETLLSLGFPERSLEVIKASASLPFTMRLDWCWNELTKQKKIIEINCQTPSFWFECLEGNRVAAKHFGLSDPNPQASSVTKSSLYRQVERAAQKLGKRVNECVVGFTALNNVEDMGTMHWLSQHLKGFGIKTILFPLEFLGIKDGKGLFYTRNNTKIDILFMWYPLEWVIHDRDEQGKLLWDGLEQLILDQKVMLVNFASGFVLQPKSIFSLITDLGWDFFGSDASCVFEYFPKTAMIKENIGHSYFAKPILGRQGEGGYAVYKDDYLVESTGKNEWYTTQAYVYQELLELPTVQIEGIEMTALWGSWLMNNGEDEFVSTGVGMRLSDGPITDDYSYWCPIGI